MTFVWTPAAYTQRNEGGCRLACYDDATGLTLPAGAVPKGIATIGYGCTGPGIMAGVVWSQAKADDEFARRYALATAQAIADLGATSWAALDSVRQAALADMAYQMGGAGLNAFHSMLAAIRSGDWQTAHDQCLASRYDRQTPGRAERNASILLTGQWPAPF